MIRDGKRQIYRVKYEKLPNWCAVCGKLGHLFKEHGSGIHPLQQHWFSNILELPGPCALDRVPEGAVAGGEAEEEAMELGEMCNAHDAAISPTCRGTT